MSENQPPTTALPTPDPRAANALRHGGRAENLIIKNEDPAEFAALLAHLQTEFSFVLDHQLIADAAKSRWLLSRSQRAYIDLESDLYNEHQNLADWSIAQHHQLALAARYKTTAERSFRRARVNLEGERQNHLRAMQRQEDARRWELKDFRDEARLTLQQQRHALAQQRFDLRAGKEKPQTDLAAAKALDEFNRLEDERYKTACGTYSRPTIVQQIEVLEHDGVTYTDCVPDNAEIFRRLSRPGVCPVENIVRNFEFFCPVPPEYGWALKAGAKPLEKGGTTSISETVSVERFRIYDQIEKEFQTAYAVGFFDHSPGLTNQELIGRMRRFFAKVKTLSEMGTADK